MSDYDQARAIDRELNATRDLQRMRELITRRRLIRAGLELQHAMERLAGRSPVGPIRDSFPFRLG
jgi:hypothetical protein